DGALAASEVHRRVALAIGCKTRLINAAATKIGVRRVRQGRGKPFMWELPSALARSIGTRQCNPISISKEDEEEELDKNNNIHRDHSEIARARETAPSVGGCLPTANTPSLPNTGVRSQDSGDMITVAGSGSDAVSTSQTSGSP